MILILTCEHGGNEIPYEFKSVFHKASNVLESHRAFDPGTLDVFEHLKHLANFSIYSKTSRLLIELNRSLGHKQLFSEFTKPLHSEEKKTLISTYYLPYRNTVEAKISEYLSKNEIVLHLSIHSFTPVLNSIERYCDIGLLYDPGRPSEKAFSKMLKSEIKIKNPNLIVRYNYPYLGKADGFTTYLRKKFPMHYMGIEIEMNQKYSKLNVMDAPLKQTLKSALVSCLTQVNLNHQSNILY